MSKPYITLDGSYWKPDSPSKRRTTSKFASNTTNNQVLIDNQSPLIMSPKKESIIGEKVATVETTTENMVPKQVKKKKRKVPALSQSELDGSYWKPVNLQNKSAIPKDVTPIPSSSSSTAETSSSNLSDNVKKKKRRGFINLH